MISRDVVVIFCAPVGKLRHTGSPQLTVAILNLCVISGVFCAGN